MPDWSNPPPEVVGAILNQNAQTLTPICWAIITNTVTAAMLVPLFIALFYFSTKSQRRSAIFIFVTLGVGVGILGAIYCNYVVVNVVIHPLEHAPAWSLMLIAILAVVPTFIVDIALFFRLVAVYPRVTTPRLILIVILAFPVMMKILRVGEWVVWVIDGTRHILKVKVGYVQSDLQRRLTVARWVLTLVDNGYMTAMFLWKLRSSIKVEDHDVMSHQSLPNTLRQRIRTVFWLVLSNFILPVPFFIATLVLVIVNPDSTAYTLITILTGFVSIVSAVYATVWRGVSRHEHQSGNITLSLEDSGLPQFRRPVSFDPARSFSEPDLASRIRRRRDHDSLSHDPGTTLEVLDAHWRESGDDSDVFKRIDKPSTSTVLNTSLPMHLRLNVDGVKSLP